LAEAGVKARAGRLGPGELNLYRVGRTSATLCGGGEMRVSSPGEAPATNRGHIASRRRRESGSQHAHGLARLPVPSPPLMSGPREQNRDCVDDWPRVPETAVVRRQAVESNDKRSGTSCVCSSEHRRRRHRGRDSNGHEQASDVHDASERPCRAGPTEHWVCRHLAVSLTLRSGQRESVRHEKTLHANVGSTRHIAKDRRYTAFGIPSTVE